MSFEIVDGMTGTKHISSDDLAALNTATVGKADCVLRYGDDFKLTMASANSATLGTGVGMVGGKRFWNQAATSLTIQSGTQGQKRNDLVVARYAKTSAGIESITPVVIKGTPTTGAAADPATTANDLKLWRVPLDGINAGTPVKLFEPVTPLATLGESVSQLTHIEVVSGTSDGAVTAPTVEGYRFVCWVACVSVGWVGICYIEQPTLMTSKVWYITQRWNSGGGEVHCFALYARA
ncbi:hypothetical protein [Slackia isoflavoniconvertens]|uniref:hypothetical protein n=1 Tax=Slackia isoflavoniconvertens TaxID=572010 RepID=UPI0016222C73|nr:hypothetical protein [Slackia isoflavoniconvertens]MBB3279773.1 hypothetical protein [Slackia isoflavoniconvertens]